MPINLFLIIFGFLAEKKKSYTNFLIIFDMMPYFLGIKKKYEIE